MSNLRKCYDCKKTINTNTDNYYMEGYGDTNRRRKIYHCSDCGKRLQEYPKIALNDFGIVFCTHGGKDFCVKSIDTKGIKIVNADFPASLETERIPIGEILARVDWSNTAPEERKEIESKFVEAFGGGIAV